MVGPIMLQSLQPKYPGWEEDLKKMKDAQEEGNEWRKERLVKKMHKRQRAHDGDRSDPQLVALDNLKLSYSGWEEDRNELEKAHFDFGGKFFWDKLEGLKNKQKAHDGDRSHPNITKLDTLSAKINYPGWESDFHRAEEAHKEGNQFRFDRFYQKLEKKQVAHEGDRSHPRLVALDALVLSFPGWEDDFRETENVHFDFEGNLFWQKLEALQSKQEAFHGDRSHPNLIKLDACKVNFPGADVDLKKAEEAHKEGNQWRFNQLVARIEKKQSEHAEKSAELHLEEEKKEEPKQEEEIIYAEEEDTGRRRKLGLGIFKKSIMKLKSRLTNVDADEKKSEDALMNGDEELSKGYGFGVSGRSASEDLYGSSRRDASLRDLADNNIDGSTHSLGRLIGRRSFRQIDDGLQVSDKSVLIRQGSRRKTRELSSSGRSRRRRMMSNDEEHDSKSDPDNRRHRSLSDGPSRRRSGSAKSKRRLSSSGRRRSTRKTYNTEYPENRPRRRSYRRSERGGDYDGDYADREYARSGRSKSESDYDEKAEDGDGRRRSFSAGPAYRGGDNVSTAEASSSAKKHDERSEKKMGLSSSSRGRSTRKKEYTADQAEDRPRRRRSVSAGPAYRRGGDNNVDDEEYHSKEKEGKNDKKKGLSSSARGRSTRKQDDGGSEDPAPRRRRSVSAGHAYHRDNNSDSVGDDEFDTQRGDATTGKEESKKKKRLSVSGRGRSTRKSQQQQLEDRPRRRRSVSAGPVFRRDHDDDDQKADDRSRDDPVVVVDDDKAEGKKKSTKKEESSGLKKADSTANKGDKKTKKLSSSSRGSSTRRTGSSKRGGER